METDPKSRPTRTTGLRSEPRIAKSSPSTFSWLAFPYPPTTRHGNSSSRREYLQRSSSGPSTTPSPLSRDGFPRRRFGEPLSEWSRLSRLDDRARDAALDAMSQPPDGVVQAGGPPSRTYSWLPCEVGACSADPAGGGPQCLSSVRTSVGLDLLARSVAAVAIDSGCRPSPSATSRRPSPSCAPAPRTPARVGEPAEAADQNGDRRDPRIRPGARPDDAQRALRHLRRPRDGAHVILPRPAH